MLRNVIATLVLLTLRHRLAPAGEIRVLAASRCKIRSIALRRLYPASLTKQGQMSAQPDRADPCRHQGRQAGRCHRAAGAGPRWHWSPPGCWASRCRSQPAWPASAFGPRRRRRTYPPSKRSRPCCAPRRRSPTPTPRAWRVRPVLRPRAGRDRHGRRSGAQGVMVAGSHFIVVAVAKGEAGRSVSPYKSAVVTTAGLKFAGTLPRPPGRPGAVHCRCAEKCKRAGHRPGVCRKPDGAGGGGGLDRARVCSGPSSH